MTTKNKAEWWLIALLVLGVVFIAFGIYNWQAGSTLQEEIFAKLPTTWSWETYSPKLKADFDEATNQKGGGVWLVVIGSVFTVAGVISLIRRGK